MRSKKLLGTLVMSIAFVGLLSSAGSAKSTNATDVY